MLFRIQTIWLFLAAVTLGLIFVLDLYRFPSGQELSILNQYINTIIAAVNVALIVFCIFKFKNLKSQVWLSLISIVLNLALLAMIFLDINSKNSSTTNDIAAMTPGYQSIGGDYLLGAFTPVASIIFSFLAIQGIRKDQKIIKDSYQRLR